MATGFKQIIERSGKGTLARLSREEQARMARNAAAAAARLKASGEYVTEVQDIRKRVREREHAST